MAETELPTHEPDPEQIDRGKFRNSMLCLAFGTVVATETFEANPGPEDVDGTRHVAVTESPVDDSRYVMFAEQDGAAALDVLRETKVAPSGDHAFHLRAFPDGVVIHVLPTEEAPDDTDDRQALFEECMEAQAHLLEDMEDQYYTRIAETSPKEPTVAWKDVYAFDRHLLRCWGDVNTGERYGIRYVWFEDDQRWHGAVELPTAQVRHSYEDMHDFNDFGRTPKTTSSLVRDHHIEYTYQSRRMTEADVVPHLEQIAAQIRAKTERATLEHDLPPVNE